MNPLEPLVTAPAPTPQAAARPTPDAGAAAASTPQAAAPSPSTPAAPAVAPHRQLRRWGVTGEQLLFWLLLALWTLNVCDLLLTRYSLWLGFATEENGVMRYFLREGTVSSTAFKIGVVTVGSLVLWRVRHRPTALVAAALLTGVFAAVVAYQAAWVLSL